MVTGEFLLGQEETEIFKKNKNLKRFRKRDISTLLSGRRSVSSKGIFFGFNNFRFESI
jgi:hypothetical protein